MRLRGMLRRLRSAAGGLPDSRGDADDVLDDVERDASGERNPIARAFLTSGVTMLRGVNGDHRRP